jgi:uncharacterized protein YidB (DUF937 family)
MSKRVRDEDDEIAAAAQELGGVIAGRSQEIKLLVRDKVMPAHTCIRVLVSLTIAALPPQALDRILELIDPHDDLYVAQKALCAADAAFFVVELLADSSDAVKLRAASVTARMAAHSAATLSRLQGGVLLGLDSSLSHALLNPVQQDLVDSGAAAALVPWLHSGHGAKAVAAGEALAALTSFFRDGKLAALEALAAALQAGHWQVLDPMQTLIDGLECGAGDALRLLEAALPSLLAALRDPAADTAADALTLLGTVCEKAPHLVAQLRADGAVPLVAQHLLQGSLAAQDAAAHALRLLTRSGPAAETFGPGGELGPSARALALRLQCLITAANVEEEARAEEDAAPRAKRGESPPADYDHGDPPRLLADICYGEDAEALLRELSAANPDIEVAQDALHRPTACSVM